MAIQMGFFGAAQNVTGSCYHLELNGLRVLVDCGMYQERELRERNWASFPFDPGRIDAVLLTHGHLDHCGLLPKLARDGFRGRILCTPATADITNIVLLDAAKIQTEDAEFKRRRHEREGRSGPYPEAPLYTVEDAQNVQPLFDTAGYGQPVELGEGVSVCLHDAGHILGSAIVELTVRSNGSERKIVFSGDLGRWDTPILRDPTLLEQADYLVVESTYGSRDHKSRDGIPGMLERTINETHTAGGNVLIPSFAVERAQEVLYHLNALARAKRIPSLPVFMDSPMAVRVTEVFKRHVELFDEEARDLLRRGEHPCEVPGLVMTRSVDESKAIQQHEGGAVIIAGSGMCTGGRIKHHIAQNITRPESTLLFVGYQARGTLGRIILEGAPEVRVLGKTYAMAMRVARINGFSAHADRAELLRWVQALRRPPRRVFVSHGEPESAKAFAREVRNATGWEADVPEYRQTVELE